MNERIRQLEDALAILQARCSNDTHPLLRDELLTTNAEQEEEECTTEVTPAQPTDVIDTFGTLSVSEHGVSRFFGPTGGAEVREMPAHKLFINTVVFCSIYYTRVWTSSILVGPILTFLLCRRNWTLRPPRHL